MEEPDEFINLDELVLPGPLLRVLLAETGAQFVSAKRAGTAALDISAHLQANRHANLHSAEFWQQILSCINSASLGAQFIWPLEFSRDPQHEVRAADMQRLLSLDGDREDAFATVKNARDASAHLDERIMKRYRHHGTDGMSSRLWGPIDRDAELLPFYCWDPEQRLFGCDGTLIEVESLLAEVDKLQRRTSGAFGIMMQFGS